MQIASGLQPLAVFLALPFLCAQVQVPRIGTVDFYGVGKISEVRLKKVLRAEEGDRLPASKGDIEELLEQVPGVVAARLEAICCQEGMTNLFVGIQEKGAAHFAFRTPPTGEATLPGEIVELYRRRLEAVERAARAGGMHESLIEGHPLTADREARSVEVQFPKIAAEHLEDLRKVLRESADPEQRAVAACVIGYHERKQDVVNDLQAALQDAEPSVRSNALHALNAIAVMASSRPDLGIQISPTWIVESLNSLALSDRLRAVDALVTLTENRPESILSLLRERALPSVIEMARWNSLRHALPPFLLAGRLAGLKEAEIQDAWTKGEREAVIGKLRKTRGRVGPGGG